MARTLAASLLLLLAALPVSAEGLSDAEAGAMEKTRSCITRQIIDLDDGTSDAMTVGKAAIRGCSAEMDKMSEVSGAGITDAQRLAFRTSFETSVGPTVAGWVLQWRSTQKEVREAAGR